MQIKSYKFNKEFKNKFKEVNFKNYPLVYILNNQQKAYIGETTNVIKRIDSHLKNNKNQQIETINLIISEEFNQSATYNIETNLINYFIAEGKYQIQNISQTKQKVMHNYKDKSYYDKEMFSKIWNQLLKRKLVEQNIQTLENKDVFKISPFKSLSVEQADVKEQIVDFCSECLKNKQKGVFVVQGEAGTGKSVLISSLYNTITNLSKNENNHFKNTNNHLIVNHSEMLKTYHSLAKKLPNMKKKKIQKSTTFINSCSDVDIAIIDEAHLLLSSKDSFNAYNGNNQINDIINKSLVTIIIYDPKQYLKISSYWDSIEFDKILKPRKNIMRTVLLNQLRMNANRETIAWLNGLAEKKIYTKPYDENFEIKIFNCAKEMHDSIVQKNEKFGLSRVVSTFDFKHSKKVGVTSYIEIDDFKLPWNSMNLNKAWAEDEQTINEVGSIYTIQGFDLNYVGVILGPSVQFDKKKNEIFIDITKYKDVKAFSVPSSFSKDIDVNKAKEQIILNSINVLLKRGMKGTYIYAYDDELRKQLINCQ